MSGWELLKLKLHLIKKCLAVTPEVSITDIAEKLGSTSQNEGESKHFFLIMPDQIALIIMFQPDTIAREQTSNLKRKYLPLKSQFLCH